MTERTHTDLLSFSREQLEKIVKYYAKTNIIGTLFIGGDIGEQTVRWLDDGGCEVLTPWKN